MANINRLKQTFFLHAEFEAFLESAVLALVTVVLVDRAVVAASTRVRQVATHRTLEEAFASFARRNAVMFTGTFVTAYDALQTDTDHRTTAILQGS